MTAPTCPSCGEPVADGGLNHACPMFKPRQPDTSADAAAEEWWINYPGVDSVNPGADETFRGWALSHKNAFKAGHARASEEMGAEVAQRLEMHKDRLSILNERDVWKERANTARVQHMDELAREIIALREQLAAAQADLQTAYDVLNNDKSYLALTEPLRKQRDAAELRAAEYENLLECWCEVSHRSRGRKCDVCEVLAAHTRPTKEAERE